MKKLFVLLLLLSLFEIPSSAMPKTIIIIRHGDGYYITAEKKLGPALSAKGYLRSFSILKYYLDVFNKEEKIPFPDYIFACNPFSPTAHDDMALSVRHIQTVAPLVTWMYEHQPKKTPTDLLQIPYCNADYSKMAKLLVVEEYVENKTILICWSHENILNLIKDIQKYSGYTMNSNWPDGYKWDEHDYETIVTIKCINETKLMKVDMIPGAIKIPQTAEGKKALIDWFFSELGDGV